MRGLSLGACPSKYLDRRWKLRDKEIHKKKLRGVKSTIRTQYQSAPFGIGTVNIRNGKKEAIMEQRYTEIERENRILLEKMSNIMQNPKPNLYTPSNNMQATQQLPPHKKSLNRERRRRDLVKITMENQAFLKRLQQKSATYSVEKWENDFVQQTKYRDLVCENPYEFGDGLPRSRLMTAAGNRGRLDYTQEGGMMGSGALPRIGSQSIQHRDQLGVGMYQTLNSQKNLQGKRAIIKQAEQLDENRIVLYKKGRQLGQGYYIVEISSNNTHLFIAAYDVESPESLLIELPERRAADILNEFNNDYEGMASSLQVMNKRLVLLNPKFINQKRHGTAPTGQPGRPPLPSQGPQSNMGQSQEMSGVINQEQSNIEEEAPNQEQDQQNQVEGGTEINIEEQNQVQNEEGDQQQQDDVVQEDKVE